MLIGKKEPEERGGLRLAAFLALLAGLVVGGQVVSILLRGETVCLNEGCQVVESLTTVSPLFFNLLGFGYFLLLAVILSFSWNRGRGLAIFSSLLLLAGAGAEGMLLSFQMYAVRTFCSYCLIIASFVLLLNLLLGWRQIFGAVAAFGGALAVSSLLNFGPALLTSRAQTLETGVYAVRQGEAGGHIYRLYLSATCPHCKIILAALPQYPRCTITINPVTADPPEVVSLGLAAQRFSPEINRLMLELFAIRDIPVLLEVSGNRYTFHEGEGDILRVLEENCVASPASHPAQQSSIDGMSLPEQDNKEGECTIDEVCNDK